MRPPQLRALSNNLIAWYMRRVRPAMRKGSARLRTALPGLALPSGWAFLTWSMFLWSPRAWAASIGIYLVLAGGVIPVVAAFAASRAAAARRSIDQ